MSRSSTRAAEAVAAAMLDSRIDQLAETTDRQDLRAVAGEPAGEVNEQQRGDGSYRKATSGREAQVRKNLWLDAELAAYFEQAHREGREPALSRLVGRLLRDHRDKMERP